MLCDGMRRGGVHMLVIGMALLYRSQGRGWVCYEWILGYRVERRWWVWNWLFEELLTIDVS